MDENSSQRLTNVTSDSYSEDEPSEDEDEVNEVGNMGMDVPVPGACFSHAVRMASRRRRWRLNYQEAAIFLEEGQNNDKFTTHPRSHEALPAYEVAHNHCFYSLDLVAAIVIMLLASCERPAVQYMELPIGVHSSLELLCLLVLSLDLFIRIKWLGFRTYLGHRRTLVKTLMIILMLTEAIVVLVRQSNHFRVTRALRPFFLVHTHYCQGVRRITRQIMQSLPPILDMIVLLLFFMLIFSILGFYFFSDIEDDNNFKTIQDSFISLFVLLTTSNYPDVMMPSYNWSRFSCLFFIVYLSLELYFLMNLLLAVVYDSFSNLEKSKVKSLFYHKYQGAVHAFRLLVTKANHHQITVKNFIGMMEFYIPNRTRKEYYLMFKALNKTKTGTLNSEEFFNVYDVGRLKWKPKNQSNIWSSGFHEPFKTIFKGIYNFATWKYFHFFIYLMIGANFIWVLVETVGISSSSVTAKEYDFLGSWISIMFVIIYCGEAVVKILGRGPYDYFTSGWDLFDFLVTVVSVVGVFGEIFEHSFYYIIVLRPFRLLRLFKVKRRYRDVLGTLFLLFSKLMSLAICIINVYYFFAIIGMEMFLDVQLKDCCKNTSVEANYRSSDSGQTGYYYLNNFNNIFSSGVTLFELTVINNWYIIMEGYANAYSQWSRAFFMLFYIVMMVVMNVVVAFVLESFMFRINYRKQMQLDTIDDDGLNKEEVTLSENEMHMITEQSAPLTGHFIKTGETGVYVYKGESERSRDDFSLRMYQEEVKEWLEELNKERREIVSSMEMRRVRQRPNTGSGLEEFIDGHFNLDGDGRVGSLPPSPPSTPSPPPRDMLMLSIQEDDTDQPHGEDDASNSNSEQPSGRSDILMMRQNQHRAKNT